MSEQPKACLFNDICGPSNSYQCEHWLRNLQGCETVTAADAKKPAMKFWTNALRESADKVIAAYAHGPAEKGEPQSRLGSLTPLEWLKRKGFIGLYYKNNEAES